MGLGVNGNEGDEFQSSDPKCVVSNNQKRHRAALQENHYVSITAVPWLINEPTL